MKKIIILLPLVLWGCVHSKATPQSATNALCPSLERVYGGNIPESVNCPEISALASAHYEYADFDLVARTAESMCLPKHKAGSKEAISCYTQELHRWSVDSDQKGRERALKSRMAMGAAMSSVGNSMAQQNAYARQNAMNNYLLMRNSYQPPHTYTTNCRSDYAGGVNCTTY